MARAQGRGSTALRDAAGNVLQMNAAAPYPLLRPQGVDGSVAFAYDGTVKIVSPDTQEDRDMTVRDVQSSGRVEGAFVGSPRVEADSMGTNLIGAGRGEFGSVVSGSFAAGRVFIDDAGVTTPGVNAGGVIGCQTVECRGLVTANDMGTNHIGAGVGNFGDLSYYRLVPPPSERRLKDHVEDITNGLHVIRQLSPARYRWRQEAGPVADDLLHAGVYVDELDEHAPEVVWHPEGAVGRTYEDRGLVAYLVAAVQELAERVGALEAAS